MQRDYEKRDNEYNKPLLIENYEEKAKAMTLKKHSEMLIIIIATIIWSIYILLVASVYPEYIKNINSIPLAMVRLLFPAFNMILLLFVLLCLYVSYCRIENKYIHISLLIIFSLMVWITPSYLSGFIWNPDTLYHIGISSHAEEIIKGQSIMFSDYFENYPASFVLNYIWMQISNIEISVFARLVYPTFFAIAIILLWYNFVSKLFNHGVAFLSTLIAIPGIHYIEIHPSPNTVSIVLLLTALILIFRKDRTSKFLGLLTIMTLIITHPESPLLLMVFMVTPYIAMLLMRSVNKKPLTALGIFGIFIGWLSWALFHAVVFGRKPIVESILRIMTLEFFVELESASTPSPFIYPEFPQLMMLILLSYGAISCLFFNVLELKNGIKVTFTRIWRNIEEKRMFMLIYFFLFIIFIYLFGFLVASSLRQRALFYSMLSLSTFIGASIQSKIIDIDKPNIKIKQIIVFFWIVIITFLYPIAAYYSAISITKPPSEKIGMMFLASSVKLNGKNVFAFRPNQLPFFIQEGVSFQVIYLSLYKDKLPLNLQEFINKSVDIAIFQRSLYYEIATMRDLSFDDNSYIQVYDEVEVSTKFNRVYSSPSILIFSGSD